MQVISNDSESEDIVEVIEHESDTESEEDVEHIGDNNNGRLRESAFSRSGREGNWLTWK